MPVLPSYRNQSIDLHSKSIDRKDNTGISWIKMDYKDTEMLPLPFLLKFLIMSRWTLTSTEGTYELVSYTFI